MSLKTSLTRAEMVAAINAGGSVQVGGRFFTKVEQLPSEADFALASGDPEAKAKTESDLDKEIARLQAEKAKLAREKKDERKPGELGPTPLVNKDAEEPARKVAPAKAEHGKDK